MQMIPPGPASPTETFEFLGDGVTLYGEWFSAENPIGACLLIHGYSEHSGRYREVAHVLQKSNFGVMTFDVRGHGKSQGPRGAIRHFQEYLADLEKAKSEIASRYSGPLAVVGHSNGALITLRSLLEAPQEFWKCAVVSSPFLGLAMQVSPIKRLAGRFANTVAPALSFPNKLEVELLTSDPEKQKERVEDTLCHDVANSRWFHEALKAQATVLERARDISIPTAWLVAEGDRIADPNASKSVYERINAPKDYFPYPEFQHEIFNETHREKPFSDLVAFLTKQFSQ